MVERGATTRAVGAALAAAALLAVTVHAAAKAPAAGPGAGESVSADADRRPIRADTSHRDTAAAGAGATADSSFVYRREVFDYPAGDLRDPFRPVDTGEQTGPSLADLTLAGILFSPDAGSVAVLVHATTGRRYRLRVGDRIGEARLVEIEQGRAVFRVEAFGFDRRTVLRLQRDEESSQ